MNRRRWWWWYRGLGEWCLWRWSESWGSWFRLDFSSLRLARRTEACPNPILGMTSPGGLTTVDVLEREAMSTSTSSLIRPSKLKLVVRLGSDLAELMTGLRSDSSVEDIVTTAAEPRRRGSCLESECIMMADWSWGNRRVGLRGSWAHPQLCFTRGDWETLVEDLGQQFTARGLRRMMPEKS